MDQSNIKIGSGYDVHRLVPDRPLIIGGVEIEHTLGLEGHSDADVLVHAICDAMLGAVGAGDIGEHFPDTDPKYKGISSMLLLERCQEILGEKGYILCNMDCIIFAQKPKMSPHKIKMKENIARTLDIDPGLVNIKATTTERLGFVGKEEGIAAQCTLIVTTRSRKENE